MTTPNANGKSRVAILGGGMAGLTAAFEITEQDPNRSKYEITVYTLGWRLGGKAAVGRDAAKFRRGYEHGLHIWAGYYDNAFDVMKRLYARLTGDPDAWRKCFEPLNHFTAMEKTPDGWKPWFLEFPPNDLEPGLGPFPIVTSVRLVRQFFGSLEAVFDRSDSYQRAPKDVRDSARATVEALRGVRPLGRGETPVTRAREIVEQLLEEDSPGREEQRANVVRLLDLSLALAADAAAPEDQVSDERRRLTIFCNLALALARGLMQDDVLLRGFEALDDEEWSHWMRRHGAKDEDLDSAVVRGCYDYAFASSVTRDPGIGAGTASLLFLRLLLTYRGSIMYALTEPMGDCIVMPFYQYLKDWGVKFEFFSRLAELKLSKDGSAVEQIVLSQQAQLKKGPASYKPESLRADGKFSWPAAPFRNQIVHGERLKGVDLESAWAKWEDVGQRVLWRRTPGHAVENADETFDVAVLATGFGGLKSICGEVAARFPATWGLCFKTMRTTQTLALQLWLKPQIEDLGWPDPQTALTAFEQPREPWEASPLTTWEDNTRLLKFEDTRHRELRSLAYFANDMPDADHIPEPGADPDFPHRETKRAKDAVIGWMNERLGSLWPGAISQSKTFRWELLEAPAGVKGVKRLDHQYLRANVNPWERYVLAAPGSVQHRLWPDRSGLSNLYLAGDWVRSGVNAGCVEAAVIAGRMAARAITESDMSIPGDGNSGRRSVPFVALPLLGAVDKLKSAAAGGVGAVEAYCVTTFVSAAYAQARLASGLRLAPSPEWGGFHPLVLVFSRQRNVRPGFVPFGGLSYHEFAQIIPYVDRSDVDAPSGGPFSYMPNLFLDQRLPVAVGVNAYGFNKRMARISAQQGNFTIGGDLGEIRARFRRAGLAGGIQDFPNIAANINVFKLPLISRRQSGEWVYSYLHYDLPSAVFQYVVGRVVGRDKIIEASPIESGAAPRGRGAPTAFRWYWFSANWRISVPLTSGQLSEESASQQLHEVASLLNRSQITNFIRR